jgi:hypothetical protein
MCHQVLCCPLARSCFRNVSALLAHKKLKLREPFYAPGFWNGSALAGKT